nr:uncharacterized protein LOC109154501 [Ipomoea batatas]
MMPKVETVVQTKPTLSAGGRKIMELPDRFSNNCLVRVAMMLLKLLKLAHLHSSEHVGTWASIDGLITTEKGQIPLSTKNNMHKLLRSIREINHVLLCLLKKLQLHSICLLKKPQQLHSKVIWQDCSQNEDQAKFWLICGYRTSFRSFHSPQATY